jgi:hypothetical protein
VDAVTPSLGTGDVLFSLLVYVTVYAVIYSFGFHYIYRLLRDGPCTGRRQQRKDRAIPRLPACPPWRCRQCQVVRNDRLGTLCTGAVLGRCERWGGGGAIADRDTNTYPGRSCMMIQADSGCVRAASPSKQTLRWTATADPRAPISHPSKSAAGTRALRLVRVRAPDRVNGPPNSPGWAAMTTSMTIDDDGSVLSLGRKYRSTLDRLHSLDEKWTRMDDDARCWLGNVDASKFDIAAAAHTALVDSENLLAVFRRRTETVADIFIKSIKSIHTFMPLDRGLDEDARDLARRAPADIAHTPAKVAGMDFSAAGSPGMVGRMRDTLTGPV